MYALVAGLSTRKITSATWTRCGLRPETDGALLLLFFFFFFRTADVNVNCQLPTTYIVRRTNSISCALTTVLPQTPSVVE